MSRIVAFAVAIAALTAFSTGCAADEMDERGAAYPTPIGITPPSQLAAPDPAPYLAESAPNAPPETAPQSPPAEVIGADDEPQAAGPDESASTDAYADTDPSALNDFHAALDPYGSWVDDPNYGTVWVPSQGAVGDGFSPYVSGGHWAYDDDYTWVSDYGWGWAPFHYGRWVYAGNGWSWIPGRTYAGAWVDWRYGSGQWGYVGWAPRPPAYIWRGGAAVGIGFVPRMPYAFVANRDLFAGSVRGRLIAGPEAGVIGVHTHPWAAGALPRAGGFGARLGPPPSILNISASAVVRTQPGNPGIVQARAFARPNGAGAFANGASPRVSGGAYGGEAWRGGASGRPSVPAYAPAPSHFGGRLLGRGFAGNSATPSAYRSVPGGYYGASRGAPSYAGGSAYRPAREGVPRSYGGSPGMGYGRPSVAYAGGSSFRSAGGGAPYRPSSESHGGVEFHPSSGGGGFHASGGGGGGGFHASGGGGGGGHGGRR